MISVGAVENSSFVQESVIGSLLSDKSRYMGLPPRKEVFSRLDLANNLILEFVKGFESTPAREMDLGWLLPQ